jgi:hypothetical protein
VSGTILFLQTQAGLLIVLPILESLWEEHDLGSMLVHSRVCGNLFLSETKAGLLIVLPILQSLWEDHDSGSRLAMVNPYLLGSDLPQSISKPCVEEDEVSQLIIVM